LGALSELMLAVLRSKLGRGLIGSFFLLALPLFFAGWLSLHNATQAIDVEAHQVLRSASDGAEAQLRELLGGYKRALLSLTRSSAVLECLKGGGPGEAKLLPLLDRLKVTEPQIQEIFCLNARGKVIGSVPASVPSEGDATTPVFVGSGDSFSFGDVIRGANGKLQWRMSAPVIDPATGVRLGLLVMGIDPQVLSDLATGRRVLAEGADTQSYRIGTSGETYLVNANGLMITQSRFITNAVLAQKVDTEPVKVATETGQEMMGDYVDYRGVKVSGASAIIRDTGWVMVTEIDFSQVFAGLTKMRKELLGVLLLVGIVALVVAARISRNIIMPLNLLGKADQALARGDERAAFVPETNLRMNELGEFARSRNRRVKLLINRHRELLREQKARAEAARALQQVSYSMVHEMRAPLRAITGFAELVELDQPPLNEEQRSYLQRIKRSSKRMDKLICDMMRYSSMLRQAWPIAPVTVLPVLEKVIANSATLREHKEDIDIAGDIPAVMGNEAALSEVFAELLDNAFRYTRIDERAHVHVFSEVNDRYVRICFQDNGMGIAPEFAKKIFDIYERGTSLGEGSGIGLALVRVAVERMGGRVGVTSELSQGSLFWVELKAAGTSSLDEEAEGQRQLSDLANAIAVRN
jgi:signal transduction histidine kinase